LHTCVDVFLHMDTCVSKGEHIGSVCLHTCVDVFLHLCARVFGGW
jgi:hypothetical protein